MEMQLQTSETFCSLKWWVGFDSLSENFAFSLMGLLEFYTFIQSGVLLVGFDRMLGFPSA